jgi:mRNA interferase RelE/StbE
MPYHVTVLPAADKAIARLPKHVRRRIAERLASLAADPRPVGSVKLSGHESYRIRVGDYRIVYTIEDDRLIVLVIEVGHRREVYRRM